MHVFCLSTLAQLFMQAVEAGTPKITSLKFSDDTAVLALLNKGNDSELSHYHSEIQRFVNWHADNHL